MKIKEVCDRTGLSRKTVRLYLEKGLVAPASEIRNGRTFRTWSEEDVQQLEVIASLRRACFTMEEIQRMQEDPAAIQEIIPQYIEWLTVQQRTLQGLLAAAKALDIPEVQSVDQLSRNLSAEANKLPLPPTDLEPHFKYLDELEEREHLGSFQEPLADDQNEESPQKLQYKTNKRDWFLFHMTPLGMGLSTDHQETDVTTRDLRNRQILLLVCGLILIGLIIALYLSAR